MNELVVRPIGFVRSPFEDKADAPRQATLASGVAATVEILPEYRDALADLEGFERIWLVFWFDRAEGWRSKVLPPRSDEKRGVFATRSPHRPNPIGMSAVRLERIEGGVLHIRDLDMIDGTPVIDVKPYVPYADAFPDAAAGWLDARVADPIAAWKVDLEPSSEERLAWIASNAGPTNTKAGASLRERIAQALALGPQPHAYRRIKESGDGKRTLAVKEWRVCFRADEEGRRIVVESIASGYRARDLASGREPVHDLHRAFVKRFG